MAYARIDDRAPAGQSAKRSSTDSLGSLASDDINTPQEFDYEEGIPHDEDDRDHDDTALISSQTAHFGDNALLLSLTDESNKSSMKMAFMNMANSIIGAGIIGQAYAVRESGLAGGIVLLIALTIVIDWTIRLMVTNAKLSSTETFQATVSHCFGRTGFVVISLAQGLFAFGGSMAFCVIIGDTIPHVLATFMPSTGFFSFFIKRNVVIVLSTLCISYPLALSKNIAHLAKASGLALISMTTIVLTVIIRGPMLDESYRSPIAASDSAADKVAGFVISPGIFQGISVISFAFVCHHNSLLIFDSLKRPTMDRFARVTHWSTGVSMVACMLMGVGGFLIFGTKTKGNVLNNFPSTDAMANVARFCFGFNMLTTLPLEIFVCREVLLIYMYPDETEFNKKRHIIYTTALVLGAMVVSLFTCDLGAILELVGATTACVMAYILPPACYIKLSSKGWKSKLACYLCIGFGVIVMFLSTGQTIYEMIRGKEGESCVAD